MDHAPVPNSDIAKAFVIDFIARNRDALVGVSDHLF